MINSVAISLLHHFQQLQVGISVSHFIKMFLASKLRLTIYDDCRTGNITYNLCFVKFEEKRKFQKGKNNDTAIKVQKKEYALCNCEVRTQRVI